MERVLTEAIRLESPFDNAGDGRGADGPKYDSKLSGLDISFPMPQLSGLLAKLKPNERFDDAIGRTAAEFNRLGVEIDEPRTKASQGNVIDSSTSTKELQKDSTKAIAVSETKAEVVADTKQAAVADTKQADTKSFSLESIKDAAGYWQRVAVGSEQASAWQAYDSAGRHRETTINGADLTKVENFGRAGVRLQLKDGSSYTEKQDGSILHHDPRGKLLDIKYPDGNLRKFEWDGAELKSMIQPDGKTTEHLVQEGKYGDQWKLADGSVWVGKIDVEAKNGDCKIRSTTWPENGYCSVAHSDGSKDELHQDGSHTTKFANGDQVEFDSNAHAKALVTADGVRREFANWSIDLSTGNERPASIKVTLPKSTQASEWQFKDNKWQSSSDSGLYSFEVNPRTGQYSFRDNDSGELKRFVPGASKESSLGFGGEEMLRREYSDSMSTLCNEKGTFSVDIDKNAAVKIVDQARQRYVTRDDKGQVTELRDIHSNTLWRQNESNEWKASAINPNRAFTKPDAEPGKANLVVDSLGLCTFISDSGATKKLSLDGKLSALTRSEGLRAQLNSSTNLQAEGKQRLTESIQMIETRNDLNEGEKDSTIKEVQRLVSSTEKSSYSQSDREVIAAQTLWHLARPNRQEQGQHPTCNVTTVRSTLIHETPSDFARMIADIGTSDKFTTADGSEIMVPASMVAAAGPDLQFPPSGGNRSWISHISDVAMANAFWQRQTIDTYGQTVPKGSLKYLEIEPQYKGDNGERLYCYADGKVKYELRERGQNALARTPELYPADILELMSQITGKPERGRVIANKSQYPNVGAGVAVIENQQGFDSEMNHGPWPKIIAVHTSRDPFWQDSGYGTAGGAGGRTGGWHVVVATGYDAKTGRVAIDNSWQPERDHNGPSRQISTKMLYESTIGQQP